MLVSDPSARVSAMEPAGVLALMRRRLAEGDLGGARALCDGYFMARPDLRDEHGHPVYLTHALRIALAAGDAVRAHEYAVRLGAALPAGDPLVPLLLARHHAAGGEAEQAAEQWRAVLAIDPHNAEAREALPAAPPAQRASPAIAHRPPLRDDPALREGDYFEGDSLPESASFDELCASTTRSDAPDTRFVHAQAGTSRAPFGDFVRDETWFGPGRHVSEGAFQQATSIMHRVETISLGDAVYAPAYCLIFSPGGGLHVPTAGDFDAKGRGPRALAEAYDDFEIDTRGRLQLRGLEALPYVDGVGIPVCGMGWHNYGHFLFDGLSLATYQANMLRGADVHLIGQALHPWQSDILDALGLRDRYLWVRKPTRFRRIVASNQLMGHVPFPTRFARLAFDLIRLRLGAPAGARDRRVMIMRPDKPGRRYLENRAEVAACAQQHGFDVMEPDRLSFAEQVRLFAAASVVVGESGAAMANIGFCDPGAQVLEIMPEVHNELWTRGACNALGHQWHVYFARVTQPAPAGAVGADRLNFRYVIDIDSFAAALRHITRAPGSRAVAATNDAAAEPPAKMVAETLPCGPWMAELVESRRPPQTFLIAKAERRHRHPPFHMEPTDPAVAQFGQMFTDPEYRSYEAAAVTASNLPGATVFGSSGLVAWNNHILGDSAQSLQPWQADSLIAEANQQGVRFRRPVPIPGGSLPGAWYHAFSGAWPNYAHWMTEAMPKIVVFRALRRHLHELGLLVPDFGVSGFHARTLELLGLDNIPLHRLSAQETVTPGMLWYSPRISMWGVPSIVRIAAETLAAAAMAGPAAAQVATGDRVYLHREEGLRRVANFDEIAPQLAAEGFHVVAPDKLTLDAQIATMQRARFVIAEHGAGAANLMFCRPGARVLELFNSAAPQPAHWVLASVCDVAYGFIVGSHVPSPMSPLPGWNADYAISKEQLAVAMRALLGR